MKIGSGQRYFQPSRFSYYIILNSRVHVHSFRVVIFINFLFFSDRRSLKIENGNNSMKT